jgi:hypothetical protein
MVDRGMNADTFKNLYALKYPLDDIDKDTMKEYHWAARISELHEKAKLFRLWFNDMEKGYREFTTTHFHLSNKLIDSYLEENKGIWLFYKTPTKKFCKEVQMLALEHNNPLLTVSDYAYLLYASSLADESFIGLPLSILHDIFDPIAEQNIKSWRTSDI